MEKDQGEKARGEQPVGVGLLELPVELRSLVFSFVDTRQLYPHCFLICKALLVAVLDEQAWQARCFCDLQITELSADTLSWRATYKGTLIPA